MSAFQNVVIKSTHLENQESGNFFVIEGREPIWAFGVLDGFKEEAMVEMSSSVQGALRVCICYSVS